MKRLIPMCLALLTIAAAPAAAAPATHRVNLSGEIETLASTGTIGMPGVRDTDTGIIDGSIADVSDWHGALRQLVTWGAKLAITVQGTAFDASGTLRYRLTGGFVPRPGGLLLRATGRVTGGTGRYARASGRLRATGVASVSAGSSRSSLHLGGAVRLPHA